MQKNFGFTVEKVIEIQRISVDPVSLETPVGDEEDTHLGDFLPDEETPAPHESASYLLLKEQLEDVMKNLTEREARFGIDNGKRKNIRRSRKSI